MKIADCEIGTHVPPYTIAEISANHCGSLDKAKKLIRIAKECGADICKFQCYSPDTITLKSDRPDFILKDGPWKGRTLYDLYSEAQTPMAWFPALFRTGNDEGIPIFASVFDETSVDLLAYLGTPAIKIASFEITDTPLIEYAAKTGKPLIISTGMASDLEIKVAFTEAAASTEEDIGPAFLHCVSAYPSIPAEANLHKLAKLRKTMPAYCPIGISDHSFGSLIPIAAVALGATIIEKHLIESRSDKSPDHMFSLEPNEFKKMVRVAKDTWEAMQEKPIPAQEPNRVARRSLYAVKPIGCGECFTENNVRSIRPGYGLSPSQLPQILGKTASRDIAEGEAMTEDMLG